MVNYIEYTTHNTQKSLVNALRHLKTTHMSDWKDAPDAPHTHWFDELDWILEELQEIRDRGRRPAVPIDVITDAFLVVECDHNSILFTHLSVTNQKNKYCLRCR